MTARNVFITGGTGYVGRALVPRLLERGHEVRSLVRRGSETRLPRGCEPVIGNALDASYDSRERTRGYDPASLVRARSGTPLALCVSADVLALREHSRNARDGTTFGIGHVKGNGCRSGAFG